MCAFCVLFVRAHIRHTHTQQHATSSTMMIAAPLFLLGLLVASAMAAQLTAALPAIRA